MSLTIERNKSLKNLNSFGFDQRAELFAQVVSERQVEDAVRYASDRQIALFILGGGSNIVLTDDIPGLVLQPADTSTTIHRVDSNTVRVSAAAGLNWHALVQYTLDNGIAGLENLSLIPGSVGAAPVQNIGAYGVEIEDRIGHVRALHTPSMQWLTLSAGDCAFSYRHSLFKSRPAEYIITRVEFLLGDRHALQTSYDSLSQHLQTRNIAHATPRQVSESVIAIRESKLPDPQKIGNAGSFFHNPKVAAEHYAELKKQHPNLPSYPQDDGTYKLAAGWLIDNLGLKGIRKERVGIHDAQALVLINLGGGTGSQIMALANDIQSAVLNTYGVCLQIEPTVIGGT